MRRPKKEEPAPDEEQGPEPLAEESTEEEAKEKAVLKNPVWVTEEPRFNEDVDLSVDAELPEGTARTKVAFELFATTPDGEEKIGTAEGHVEDGKAVCRIPLYQPQYKEDGELLEEVEYFFTAKHSQSDLLKDKAAAKIVSGQAEKVIDKEILEGITFAFDSSFLDPAKGDGLDKLTGRIGEWKKEWPEGKMAIFGHADASGREEYNQGLSERRARSMTAFLLKDPEGWETLHGEEKWTLKTVQSLLKALGHDPGAMDGKDGPKTQAAVKAFQGEKGITADGKTGPDTRKALFQAFMDAHNPLSLAAKDFDAVDGKPHAGCSEFNLADKEHPGSMGNRRVTVLLLKASKNFPVNYPCKHGSIAPCQSQAGRKGDRRTAGFRCAFYDKLVAEAPGPGGDADGKVRIGLPLHPPSEDCAFTLKVVSDGATVLELDRASCAIGEDGLAFLEIDKPAPGKRYSISLLRDGSPEETLVADFEFNLFLEKLQSGKDDFERPEFSGLDWESAGEADLDGDTLGGDPPEAEPERLASLPKSGAGFMA